MSLATLAAERGDVEWAASYIGGGISPRTLNKWRLTGAGPSFLKIGGRVVYDRKGLDEYLESCRRQSTSGVAA